MDLRGRKLVIFGCGDLGERVAREALRRGLVVTGLTRNRDQAKNLRRLNLHQVVEAELDGTAWHPEISSRQDFVLNCVSSAGGGTEGYRKSYLEGMRSMVNWAAGGEVGTVVFTSSTSVYGQGHEEWVEESDLAEGASGGGGILRETEELLMSAPLGASRRFVLRLGGIYGPGRHWLLNRALCSDRVEEGDEVFLNSIHVEDAASAVWKAFESGPEVSGGIFNIVDGNPTRKREIIRYLRTQLEERHLIPSDPLQVESARRRSGARPSRKISNAKACAVLGWEPRYPDYRAGYGPLLESMVRKEGGYNLTDEG